MNKSNKINILDESIAKKIAAGEIVERPASVVKELIENAIDAQANNISIEIKDGGKEFISISDNGIGISSADTKLAFIRHATSKISTLDDLYNIHQMGFRGEALYSISAVSKVILITKTRDENIGSVTKVDGGEILENHEYGCPDGTTIIIEDLFFNTPARKKFMKKSSIETGNISAVIQKYILSYPNISFKFINNDKVIYYTNGNGNIINSIFAVYGKDVASNVVEFSTDEQDGVWLNGCLGNKNLLNKTRNGQTVFINNRYVKDKNISMAIEHMYSSNLMKHSYPFFIVNVNIDPILVDVNVHPQKLNVVFSNIKQVLASMETLLASSFAKINGQVLSFESEKINLHVKKVNTQQLEPTEQSKDVKFDNINTENKIAEPTAIDIKDEILAEKGEDANGTPKPNLSYDLNEFNYKSALLLDKNSSNLNQLKQTSAATNLQYEQSQIDELTNSFSIIGSAFKGYLMIECNESIYIFDQHAAHERLIFESFQDTFSSNAPITQSLLIPQTIELPYDDILIVQDNIDAFEKVGYNLGANETSIDILGVPVFLGQPQMQGFFKEILANLSEINENEGSITDKIISMSCKKAVKAGDGLKNKEIEKLIDLIINNDIKLTCPHGRPFVTVITKKQLEKRFGRIV